MDKRKKSRRNMTQERKEKLEDEKTAQFLQRIAANQSKIDPSQFTCAAHIDDYFTQLYQGISQKEIEDILKIKVDRLIRLWEPMLDELVSLEYTLMKEKCHSYNANEALTYPPKQREYTDTLISSISYLETVRKGIMITLGNLKGTEDYWREVAIICSAGRRDELKVLLGDLKGVGVPVDTKQIEELLCGVDKVVAGQMDYYFG